MTKTVTTPETTADIAEALRSLSQRLTDAESQRVETETRLSRLKRQRGEQIAAGGDASAITREIRETGDELDGIESAITVLGEQRAALERSMREAKARESEEAKRTTLATFTDIVDEIKGVARDAGGRIAALDQMLEAAGRAVNQAEAAAGGFVGQGAVSEVWRRRPGLAELLNAVRHYQRQQGA